MPRAESAMGHFNWPRPDILIGHRHQVRDSEIARDLTQETFLRAYRSLNGYRNQSSFGTWLTRIALNVSNSYFGSRRYKDYLKSVSIDVSNYTHLATTSLEDLADNHLEELAIQKLQLCISKLQPKYRDVVTLCILQKMKYAEAAQILEIPETTVNSRLHTAITELRKLFRRTK